MHMKINNSYWKVIEYLKHKQINIFKCPVYRHQNETLPTQVLTLEYLNSRENVYVSRDGFNHSHCNILMTPVRIRINKL